MGRKEVAPTVRQNVGLWAHFDIAAESLSGATPTPCHSYRENRGKKKQQKTPQPKWAIRAIVFIGNTFCLSGSSANTTGALSHFIQSMGGFSCADYKHLAGSTYFFFSSHLSFSLFPPHIDKPLKPGVGRVCLSCLVLGRQ